MHRIPRALTGAEEVEPLHATTLHDGRVAIGLFMIGWALLAVPGVVRELIAARSKLGLAILPVMVLVLVHTAWTVLRLRAIYGTARGVIFREGGAWTLVPWSEVKGVKVPFGHGHFAITFVGARPPVHFFGTRKLAKRIEALRAAGAG
jgi:hypothetical protein